jgi:hypothetical protein
VELADIPKVLTTGKEGAKPFVTGIMIPINITTVT